MSDTKRRDKAAFTANFCASLVLGVIILLEVIYLGEGMSHLRWDVTENQEFSLTDSTINVLDKLDEEGRRVSVKAFISRDVPPYVEGFYQRIRDLLAEYEAYADGMLVVDYVDPADDETLEEEAQRLGISPQPLSDRGTQKLSMQNVYQGLRLRSGDRQKVVKLEKELMAFFRGGMPNQAFEYKMTNAISELTLAERPKVALYAKSETPPMNMMMQRQRPQGTTYNKVKEILKGRYKVEEIELVEGQMVPEDAALLVMIRPKELDEMQQLAVDQFLVKGGKAIFFVDENPFGLAQSQQHKRGEFKSGLKEMLMTYGVDLRAELVADLASFQRRQVQIPGSWMPQLIPYYYYVTIKNTDWSQVPGLKEQFPAAATARNGMSQEFPAVKQLDGITFLWTGPVYPREKMPEGVSAQVLLRSSPVALTEKVPDSIHPGYRMEQVREFIGKFSQRLKTEEASQVPLAVKADGVFTSWFKDRSLPEPPAEEEDEGNPETAEPGHDHDHGQDEDQDRDGVRESVPVQEKPAEAKPAQEKPAAEKPAEAKPAQEKPAEEKPAAPETEEKEPAEGQPEAGKAEEKKPMGEAEKRERWGFVEKGEKPGSLIVVGESTILDDQVFNEQTGLYEQTRALFLNLVDSLALDPELVGLRSRSTQRAQVSLTEPREGETPREREEREEGIRFLLRAMNVLVIPILLVGFGLVVFFARRARKRSFIQSLQGAEEGEQ